MAVKKTGVLTDKHLKILNDVLRMCRETEEYCADCEKCSLDVTPEKRKNEDQKRLAEKLKATFFPSAR